MAPAAYVVDTADPNIVTWGNKLNKFADDTYIVIPATNIWSQQSEPNDIHQLAQDNNLEANPNKYAKIIFANGRQRTKQKVHPQPHLSDITKVTTIKILSVTFTNSFSVAEHVHNVISLCAQVVHALRVLQAHGMDDASLQTIYRSITIAKLMYASSAC